MIWKKMSGVLVATALVLSACGGGGSAEEGSTPEDQQQTETRTQTGNQNQQGEQAQTDQRQNYSAVTLPESTVIEIALLDSIDTDVDTAGETFEAELAAPVSADGRVVFEEGARVKGRIDKIVESGRLQTPAELTISLVSIERPDGEMMEVDAYPVHEKMDSHTKRQVGLIGGGAIIGGAIGKITGKEGGTEIGIATGAAAGAAAAAATGKQDIEHPPGTKAGFFLRTPITVNAAT